MPRLTVSLNDSYSTPRGASKTGSTGRAIRDVDALFGRKETRSAPLLLDARFLKWTGGLAAVAGVALAFALWQLFHFPH
jgi:hypothetical protein